MIFSLILKIVVTSAFVILIYIPYRVIKLKKQCKKANILSESKKLLFVIYLGILIALLLIPNASLFVGPDNKITFSTGIIPQRSSNLVPFHTLLIQVKNIINKNNENYPILNVLGNSFLFIPFPILLKLNWNNLRIIKCFIISFAGVISAELIQYFEGRVFDIDDIILNGISILLGIMIYVLFVKKLIVKSNDNV